MNCLQCGGKLTKKWQAKYQWAEITQETTLNVHAGNATAKRGE